MAAVSTHPDREGGTTQRQWPGAWGTGIKTPPRGISGTSAIVKMAWGAWEGDFRWSMGILSQTILEYALRQLMVALLFPHTGTLKVFLQLYLSCKWRWTLLGPSPPLPSRKHYTHPTVAKGLSVYSFSSYTVYQPLVFAYFNTSETWEIIAGRLSKWFAHVVWPYSPILRRRTPENNDWILVCLESQTSNWTGNWTYT